MSVTILMIHDDRWGTKYEFPNSPIHLFVGQAEGGWTVFRNASAWAHYGDLSDALEKAYELSSAEASAVKA
jgi:hypothetical protein